MAAERLRGEGAEATMPRILAVAGASAQHRAPGSGIDAVSLFAGKNRQKVITFPHISLETDSGMLIIETGVALGKSLRNLLQTGAITMLFITF
jgi:hypothetical protein